MADEKLNTGPGEEKLPETPAPVTADEPQAPAPKQAAAPIPQQDGPAQPEPGDVVVSFDKINELMNEKRQTARALSLIHIFLRRLSTFYPTVNIQITRTVSKKVSVLSLIHISAHH